MFCETNGRRVWYTSDSRRYLFEGTLLKMPDEVPPEASYPHEIWFCDVRYLVKHQGSWVYSIVFIDGYSRMMLAGTEDGRIYYKSPQTIIGATKGRNLTSQELS